MPSNTLPEREGLLLQGAVPALARKSFATTTSRVCLTGSQRRMPVAPAGPVAVRSKVGGPAVACSSSWPLTAYLILHYDGPDCLLWRSRALSLLGLPRGTTALQAPREGLLPFVLIIIKDERASGAGHAVERCSLNDAFSHTAKA